MQNKPVSNSNGLQPAARVATGTAYRLPATGVVPNLRLDRNEGRPSEASVEAIKCVAAERLRRYPQAAELEATLARQLNVAPNQVLVTAGGDDALLRVCLAFLEPGREIVLPTPTFEMLSKYARLAGGQIKEVPWPAGVFPTQQVIDAIFAATGIVAVVSPNNPTGAIISPDDFERLAAATRASLLLVDLAYTEFADVDLTPLALQNPNAIVVRTFSKAWGLAGIRCGYAVGPAELIEYLRRAGNPYPVTGPSIAVALAALENGLPEQQKSIDRARWERTELKTILERHGLAVVASQANFVFARTMRAESIWRELLKLGIAVRWFGDQPDLCDALRITCPGDENDFSILTKALAVVLKTN
jgi:histidinol-phosphate aminotransferase